ncbi:MAG: hypothetical protein ABI664_03145 [bacterium]
MKSSLRVLAACVTLVGTACSAEKRNVDTAASVATPAPSDNSVSSWTVTAFGIGPLHAGMSTREGVAVLQGAGVTATADSSKECHYLAWSGPQGVRVMLDGGVVARVQVDSGSIATAEGAKIGDTEARVQGLYTGRVAVQPHKYTTGGHYLVVTPPAPSDSAFRIVFETDGKSVKKYRAGRQPQVSYVEGCG